MKRGEKEKESKAIIGKAIVDAAGGKGTELGWRQITWKRLQGPNARPPALRLNGAERRHRGHINTSK